MWIVYIVPYILILAIIMFLAQKEKNIKYIYLILACFVGFSYAVGWDYFNYLRSITIDGRVEDMELFSKYIGLLSLKLGNKQWFFIIHAFITMFFFLKGFKRISIDYKLTLFIYITFPYLFLTSFTIIRYMAAFAIVFYSSTYLIKDRKIVPFIIGLFFAYNFHHASIVAILFLIPYFFRNISIGVNIIIFIICIILSKVIASLLVNQIYNLIEMGFIGDAVESKFEIYNKLGEDVTLSTKIPIMYYGINVINLLFKKQIYQDSKEVNKYITIYNIGCCLMILFGNVDSSMSSRFGMLFLIYFTILSGYLKQLNIKVCVYILGIMLYIYMLSMDVSHPDFIGRRNCFLPYSLFFVH